MQALRRLLPVAVVAFLTVSCSGSVFSALDRTAADPTVTAPTVDSLAVDGEILISWKADPAADSYRLYRDTSPTGTFSNLVYSGTGTSYADAGVSLDTMYYYELAKVRGDKVFSKSIFVPGVTSSITKNNIGNNDKADALELVTAAQQTIYYYQDGLGNVITEPNWYYMVVPPRSYITITVTNFQNTNTGELYCQVQGNTGVLLSTTGSPTLYNYGLTSARVYFQIYADPSVFVGVAGSAGGHIGSYVVEYVQTNAI